ncbi:MAG TPA: radical SAM protein [Bryobacteraceae bacterium]|nr:radical SAM protein [Bryobacteraceae bacterium]
MHDFRSKLSDPRVSAAVESYLSRARLRRGMSRPAPEAAPADSACGPVSINLDLTLACDYRCGHCIDSELLNAGRHLPPDVVRGTLEVLAARGLRSVILIGGGEPTLHPFFEDVVAAIKDLALECAIASNGAHNEKIERVAARRAPRDWIRLSLDAGTNETFQALHQPRKPITLEHILQTAARVKRRAPQVQLGFSFVVMWVSPGQALRPVASNVREMPLAAALAKRHGFDYISFKPMLVRSAARAEVINLGRPGAVDEIREFLRAAQAAADAGFRVVPSRNLLALLEGSGLERSGLQPRECHMQQFRQVVTPQGVYACPAHRGSQHSLIADCSAYTTPEAFGETARLTEIQIERFNAAAECREITCIYNDANWWLEDLVESGDPIQHLDTPDFFL